MGSYLTEPELYIFLSINVQAMIEDPDADKEPFAEVMEGMQRDGYPPKLQVYAMVLEAWADGWLDELLEDVMLKAEDEESIDWARRELEVYRELSPKAWLEDKAMQVTLEANTLYTSEDELMEGVEHVIATVEAMRRTYDVV